ncbi:GlxA family transcriptional regulator (plasmid) [Paenarthrobacter sp. OM7]|uniref:GlxA family transcriptional regulator n=1 Tax=Paenarthrobacter sp. OM7 TaxID=3041264 RepID=UPI0024685B1D|nr:GlxA family transcriptional regulator [Paenarthrobacter sp. OM7]WGM22912.1 GlxA family transcriptional regulator [Paenarthrobacter sp. OM7]
MTPSPQAARRTIALLVFDGIKVLDVTGPAEVFAEANRMGANYNLLFISPDGRDVSSSIGVRFPVHCPASELAEVDTLLVSGGDVFPFRPVPEELIDALLVLSPRARRTGSICTGAFVLAAAGLLEGRRATTHWKHVGTLAKLYPEISVEPDLIFVRDGHIYTSAGVSSGIDLALALVEEDHGPDLTRAVARSLVVYMQRAGGQSQFSASLAGPSPRTSTLREVVDFIQANPAVHHSIPDLAGRAHVSARHLGRLFATELDTTPGKYVELVRFDAAKALLDGGHSVTDAAEHAGFGNSEALRRAFIHRLGVSPSKYQQRFRTTTGS